MIQLSNARLRRSPKIHSRISAKRGEMSAIRVTRQPTNGQSLRRPALEQGQRVDGRTLAAHAPAPGPHLEVQMRPGRIARRTERADPRAGHELLPRRDDRGVPDAVREEVRVAVRSTDDDVL